MKINEVEQLVGVTKRNIRFYEKEGLLNPGRNADNGYRDYTDADAEVLRKVKLLRKLDVPLEEIRKMQQGVLTLEDGLRRHIIQLEREQANLSTIRSLCQTLADGGQQLADLEAGRWLAEMERMEGEGTRFVNIHKKDTVTHYIPPVVCALLFVALMGGVMALLVWAAPQTRPRCRWWWCWFSSRRYSSSAFCWPSSSASNRFKEEKKMLLLNIEYIPGKQIQALGIAKGSVVQSKHFGKDFMAGMKTLVGGEIESYTKMLTEARQIATKRMVDDAQAMGADAVVGVRYTSASIMQGAAEITAYGTAVKIVEG